MWMYAAYCVAKVQRDATLTTVAEAQKQEVGTGYLHDWRTRNFLHVYVGKKKRSVHPVNIIRYHGWNRKILDDWKTIEEYVSPVCVFVCLCPNETAVFGAARALVINAHVTGSAGSCRRTSTTRSTPTW